MARPKGPAKRQKFYWTAKAEEGSILVARGELEPSVIAKQVGVSMVQLNRWLLEPEFLRHVTHINKSIRERVLEKGVGTAVDRVCRIAGRVDRMNQLIAERASDPELKNVPGGTTGLIVKDFKTVGSGKTAKPVEVVAFDYPLVKAMLEHEKQISQELGQWTEKAEVKGGVIYYKELVGVDTKDL